MKTIQIAAAMLACGVAVTGCATVTRGTTTKFTFQTTPSAASVKTSTGFSCGPTPCTLKLQRKEAFDATFTKVGFKTQTAHVASKVAGGGTAGFAGNVVAGGLIGMAIDGSNGSMDDLVPNPLVVTLASEDTVPTDATAAAVPVAAVLPPAPATPAAVPVAPTPPAQAPAKAPIVAAPPTPATSH